MIYCIDQPGSLGDILFTIKIGEELSKKGEVYWYVSPIFWERGVSRIKTFAHIGPSSPRQVLDSTQIKLCDLTHRSDPDLMIKKYESVDMNWEDWSDYLKYERNSKTESDLKNILGIEPGDKYILFNEKYGMNQIHHGVKKHIPKDYDGKIIEMQILGGITIFDWCGILENAEQIHTIDTSIQYVMETLDLKASRIVAHPRHYKYTIPHVSRLFKKPWEWIEYDRETWRECAPQESE